MSLNQYIHNLQSVNTMPMRKNLVTQDEKQQAEKEGKD